MNRVLDKLERKMKWFAIPNLMSYIAAGMLLVFLFDILEPVLGFSLSEALAFDRAAIFSGEVWRVITFIFMPPSSGIFFMILALYFYWFIGSALEAQWGAFKFTFYIFIGMVLTALTGLLTGYATNLYITLSLFLAFAAVYPDYELMLFFVIPVKVKLLAYIDAVGLIALFVLGTWPSRICLLISLGNFLLFFTGDLINSIKAFIRRRKYKKEMRDYWKK